MNYTLGSSPWPQWLSACGGAIGMLAPTLCGSKPLPKPTLDAAKAVLAVCHMPSATPGRQKEMSTLAPTESPPGLGPSLHDALCTAEFWAAAGWLGVGTSCGW